MNEEQIKQKAEEYLQANYEEHPLGCRWFTHYEMVNIAINVTTEVAKELQEQIEKMKADVKAIYLHNDFVNKSPYQNMVDKIKAIGELIKSWRC